MGLDLSHGDFRIGYGGFMVLRRMLAAEIGIHLNKMAGFVNFEGDWETRTFSEVNGHLPWDNVNSPLVPLLNHSDCDGDIDIEHLGPLAKELRRLAPFLESRQDDERFYGNRRAREMARCAIEFAEACEAALADEEPLVFC